VLKQLEWLAKNLLAVVVALLCWRPGRRGAAAARLAALKPGATVLLVRIDNRVGEALLTTPVIDALAAKGFVVHALVHPKTRRVLAGHPRLGGLHDFHKRWAEWRAMRALRFDVVVNCGNWEVESVTSALVARLVGGGGVVLGPANFPSGWLMDVGVSARGDTRSEALQRTHLVSPLVGEVARAPLSFRAVAASELKPAGRYAVVNPGGRLGFRRVSAAIFAAGARALVAAGVTPVVTWGPGEEALADEVLALAPGAVRAPPTDLDQLAALMAGAVLTVCNNTGPMHLAVAVGSPTLALFLRMPVERWGHPWAPHVMFDLTPLVDAGADVEAAVAETVRAALAAPRGH
jgi:ADP-heptose:LPS heptosyltransferase